MTITARLIVRDMLTRLDASRAHLADLSPRELSIELIVQALADVPDSECAALVSAALDELDTELAE